MGVTWLAIFLACIGSSTTLSPSEVCRLKTVNCSSVFTDAYRTGNQTQCSSSIKKDFMSCVNQTMSTCDPELTLSDIIGHVEAFYDNMCLTFDTPCPPFHHCQTLMTPLSPGNYTLLPNCNMAEGVMRCYDAALATCNLTFATPYNFTHLTGIYRDVCQSINHLTCEEMNDCVRNATRPTDPEGYYDPEFLCSSFKTWMACASSIDTCPADRSSYPSTIKSVDKVCSGTPDSNVPTQETVTVKDHACVHRVDILTVLSVTSMILLSKQL